MSGPERIWKTDCRHFEGDRPCVHRRECPDCPEYSPMGRRVLVLKVGAAGDVLRTTPILPELESQGPCHVTWVAGEEAAELLAGHPRIHRLLVPGFETSERLAAERFDLCLSLDKEPYPSSLAGRVSAAEKRGFARDERGSLVPIHPDARYAYDLGLSDELKFRENQKTYQEITFEVCGLTWRGQEYDVPRALDAGAGGHDALVQEGLPGGGGPVVGLNTGAGATFANKAWTEDGYVELAGALAAEGCRVVLLGGDRERERNARIAAGARGKLLDPGPRSLAEFAALVAAMDLVVTGDTLGLHLAIAARVPVVCLFGSTCPQEIELYGRGEKVVTRIDCHPCYRRECDIHPSCQEMIETASVLAAARRVLAGASAH